MRQVWFGGGSGGDLMGFGTDPKLEGVGPSDPNVVGWSDIAVPPFCIATDEDRAAQQAFEDEVIDRLFVLNELRAKEEQRTAKQVTARQRKSRRQSGSTSDPAGQGKLF